MCSTRCEHVFCATCLEAWITSVTSKGAVPTCPECRSSLQDYASGLPVVVPCPIALKNVCDAVSKIFCMNYDSSYCNARTRILPGHSSVRVAEDVTADDAAALFAKTRNEELAAAGQRAKKDLLRPFFSPAMFAPVPDRNNGFDPSVVAAANNDFVEALEVDDESELTGAIQLQVGVLASIVAPHSVSAEEPNYIEIDDD